MVTEARSQVGRVGGYERGLDHQRLVTDMRGLDIWDHMRPVMESEEYLAEPPLRLNQNLDALYLQWALWPGG